MKPRAHVICGAIGGSAVYFASGSATAGALFISAHILMDLDHVPDYLIWSTNPRRIKGFFNANEWDNSRIVLLLHAFEWLGIMTVLLAAFPSWELASLTMGYGAHLFMDYFGNRSCKNPFFYFIIFRIMKGFRAPLLFDYSGSNR